MFSFIFSLLRKNGCCLQLTSTLLSLMAKHYPFNWNNAYITLCVSEYKKYTASNNLTISPRNKWVSLWRESVLFIIWRFLYKSAVVLTAVIEKIAQGGVDLLLLSTYWPDINYPDDQHHVTIQTPADDAISLYSTFRPLLGVFNLRNKW